MSFRAPARLCIVVPVERLAISGCLDDMCSLRVLTLDLGGFYRP